MEFKVSIEGDFAAMMQDEASAGKRAVSAAMRGAAGTLKAAWRNQITLAGLGSRLSKVVRSDAYPRGAPSLNAAAMVWTKSPHIIAAHNQGVVIRAASGMWLAIPTAAAGRGKGGKRLSPGEWQFNTGRKLTFIKPRGSQNAMLVASDVRINSKGFAAPKRGKRRKDGMLTGAASAVIFTLVPQVRLKKRMDLEAAAERVAGGVPAAIVANWR